MKYKILRQITAALLAVSLLSGCALGPQRDKTQQTAENMTVGQLADYLVTAARDYTQRAERSAVMEDFDEAKQATGLQMLVMASRAFGRLSVPEGNAKERAPQPVDVSGAPEWAKEALQNLSDGGILAQSDLSPEGGADGPVSKKKAEILAARFYAAAGSNLKDDFYAAVNQKALETIKPEDGEMTAGGSSTVISGTDKQLKNLILEIVNSQENYEKGSPEQKIRDFYRSFEDTDRRSREGIEPLRKYLDAVDRAESFGELNAAIAQAVCEIGNLSNGLFAGIAVTDRKDSSKKVLQLMTRMPGMLSEDYDDPQGEHYQEYRSALAEQLAAAGESREDAELHADGIMKLERDLAANMTTGEELQKLSAQKHYTPDMLARMMPEADVPELLKAIGLKDDVQMVVFDDKQFEAYAKWFTRENLELFKAIEKVTLLTGYSEYLSPGLAEKFGYQTIPSADIAVQNFLSEELGQLYVKHYFPAQAKAEIEKMTAMMIETFQNRINHLDWMEEETKAEALRKLEHMTVLIGYPDEWQFSGARITGPQDGGSYFNNVAASEADKWKRQLEELERPANPRKFSLAAYTVNAAASRSANTIIFPAGILQAPFYDKDASFEANLGAIGSTISHEITHMFDDGGAQYDAEGNVANWWSEQDYEHFQTLCLRAVEFYDGREAAPGIAADGKESLSENIADIGGIACGLEILSGMENPDYDAFFRSYANQWVRVAGYDTLAELTQTDSHAPNNLRCNRVLSNFQEFYDTYDIEAGDGMYVAPEDRIQIW